MRALLAVRQKKTLIKRGPWHDGKMPRSAFPLSKAHSYSLGSTWRWSVSELHADGRQYRLLVAFNIGKAQYQAWLGLVAGADQALIARLEYHPTHSGWHCHVKRGLLADVARGVVAVPGNLVRRRECDDGTPFMVTEVDAQAVAFRVFRVSEPPVAWGMFG